MSNLVAVAYPDEATAREVGQTLMKLDKEHSIELEDSRSPSGRTTARSSCARPSSPWPAARRAARCGVANGLDLFMPLLGAAIGGATAPPPRGDRRRDDNFMKDLGGAAARWRRGVRPCASSTPDKVLPAHSQYGGDVIDSSLSHDAEEALQEALRPQATAEVPRGSGYERDSASALDRLAAARRVELAVDRLEVGLDGVDRDHHSAAAIS